MWRWVVPVVCLVIAMPASAQEPPAPEPLPVEGPQPPAPEAEPAPEPEPAPPPAEAEEDLLSQPAEEPAASPTRAGNTFGAELSLFGFEATWSGYGDIVFSATPGTDSATFDSAHFNPILGVRLSDTTSLETEIEFEHGGEEIVMEYAVLDWSPVRAFKLRLGKFLVPVGQYNETFHPSFRWMQVSKPLMFQNVVPATWSEIGVMVRGLVDLAPGTTFDYTVFAVNGLSEEEGAMREDGFVRELRDTFIDNNMDKAFGARLAVSFLRGRPGATTIGISGYSGDIDDAGTERLTIVDVDADIELHPVRIHAEAAQSFLGPDGDPFTELYRGVYLQAGVLVDKTTLAARWDYARSGPAVGEKLDTHQAVGTVKYAPARSWSVRLEGAYPFSVPMGVAKHLKISSMASFVF